MEEIMGRFFIIEYQDWDENGNPVHDTTQEYLDVTTGKLIIYSNREKAKSDAKQLSNLTRVFTINSMSYWIEKDRLKEFLVVE
jgi:hypothetical protein